jgi:hypothetical protein
MITMQTAMKIRRLAYRAWLRDRYNAAHPLGLLKIVGPRQLLFRCRD